LKNHHRHIDWDQTQQTYRDAAEQGYNNALLGASKKKAGSGLAVTNPFAVDCRAYAGGVYKKEAGGDMLDGLKRSKTENTFLGCVRACHFNDAAKNSNNKATSNLVDSFDASVFPEYFCRCGEVWVSGKTSGKCVAPDPALGVSPPGYFGTTEALGVVTKNTFAKFERRSKLKGDKVKRELMEKAEREEKKRLKEEAEKQAAKKKKKKKKKKTTKKKTTKKKTTKKKTTKKKAGSRL